MKAALDRLRFFLISLFRHRPKDWRTSFLQARVHELEQEEKADIKYLRWQLTRLRAENTDLRNRGNEVCANAAPLFHLPVEELGGRWSWSTAYFAAVSWRRRPSARSGTPCCMPRCCKRRGTGSRTICRAHGATASIWNQPNCR